MEDFPRPASYCVKRGLAAVSVATEVAVHREAAVGEDGSGTGGNRGNGEQSGEDDRLHGSWGSRLCDSVSTSWMWPGVNQNFHSYALRRAEISSSFGFDSVTLWLDGSSSCDRQKSASADLQQRTSRLWRYRLPHASPKWHQISPIATRAASSRMTLALLVSASPAETSPPGVALVLVRSGTPPFERSSPAR